MCIHTRGCVGEGMYQLMLGSDEQGVNVHDRNFVFVVLRS